MSISPIFMAVFDPSAAQAATPAAEAGFGAAVQTVQSGAPPGPEPPPGISALTLPGEVGKTEPIAPFEELDLLAAMKNLTEGFFDGAPIDAPLPSTLPSDDASLPADADSDNADLRLYLSTGALAMAILPTTILPEPAMNVAVAESEGASVTALIDTAPASAKTAEGLDGYTSKAQMMADTSKAFAFGVDSKLEAFGEKIIDPIELTEEQQKLLLLENGTEATDDSALSKAEHFGTGGIRNPMPKPAEQIESSPIPKPEINPIAKSDVFGTQPKGESKSDYVPPMPKPAEEIKPQTGPISKSEHFNNAKSDMMKSAQGLDPDMEGFELIAGVESKPIPKQDGALNTAANSKAEAFKIDGDTLNTAKGDEAQTGGQGNPNASTKPNDPNAQFKPGDPNSEYKRTVEGASSKLDAVAGASKADAFAKIEDAQPSAKSDIYTPNTLNAPTAVGHAAAAETVKDVQPLDRATTNHVIRQVADRLEALAAARPRNGVTIHLEPFDLGKITMTIKSSGNDVDATIAASNEAVRVALEHSRPQLQQALDQRGISLVNIDVTGQTLTQDMPHRQQSGQAQSQTQNAPAWMGREQAAATAALTDSRTYVAKATGGVNLWI